MDALALASTILSVGAIAVAGLVAVIVGRRRGIDQVEAQADGEVKRLLEAQAMRMAILEAENRRLQSKVDTLTEELAQVRKELDIEKRVTARARERTTGDGK